MLPTSQQEIRNVQAVLDDLKQELAKDMHDSFVAKGGCTLCGGRGWVVDDKELRSVKSTLDAFTIDAYLSCCATRTIAITEQGILGETLVYPPCPNTRCTQETRNKSGLDSYYTKHDDYHNVQHPVTTSNLWKVMSRDLKQEILTLSKKSARRSLKIT